MVMLKLHLVARRRGHARRGVAVMREMWVACSTTFSDLLTLFCLTRWAGAKSSPTSNIFSKTMIRKDTKMKADYIPLPTEPPDDYYDEHEWSDDDFDDGWYSNEESFEETDDFDYNDIERHLKMNNKF